SDLCHVNVHGRLVGIHERRDELWIEGRCRATSAPRECRRVSGLEIVGWVHLLGHAALRYREKSTSLFLPYLSASDSRPLLADMAFTSWSPPGAFQSRAG